MDFGNHTDETEHIYSPQKCATKFPRVLIHKKIDFLELFSGQEQHQKY